MISDIVMSLMKKGATEHMIMISDIAISNYIKIRDLGFPNSLNNYTENSYFFMCFSNSFQVWD